MTRLGDTALEAAQAAPGVFAASRALNILIVEDDDADAYLIERVLADDPRVGAVTRAVDGVQALDLIAGGVEPDLAIIDLKMPRKDGFSLLVELACAEWLFPKIVLTSSTTRSDAVRSKLRGAGAD